MRYFLTVGALVLTTLVAFLSHAQAPAVICPVKAVRVVNPFSAAIKSDLGRWSRVVKQANIKLD